MIPLIPDTLPNLSLKQIFISAGRHDPISSVDEIERLASLFNHCGADVTTHWEYAGHELTKGDINAAREWLKRWRDWEMGRTPARPE
jgi:predicted esterase